MADSDKLREAVAAAPSAVQTALDMLLRQMHSEDADEVGRAVGALARLKRADDPDYELVRRHFLAALASRLAALTMRPGYLEGPKENPR